VHDGILTAMAPSSPPSAQQRRTRKAILDAAGRLLAQGETPSVGEVARAAEVSRRTVYLHFSSLEHLLVDAALGTFTHEQIDERLAAVDELQDVEDRVEVTIRAVQAHVQETEHLGRTIIRSAAAAQQRGDGPPRGYRRVAWVEHALEPARERLGPQRFERVVSALCVLLGWESALVLRDVRALAPAEAIDVTVFAARAIVRAALTET
jgi:AcrR family transcriptional regulator